MIDLPHTSYSNQSTWQKSILNDIIKKFRDTLIRLRLGINELGVNKRFQHENATKSCPFCPGVHKDEIHFLFICPVYAGIRHKYLREFTDNDVEPSLNFVYEKPSIDANRKVSMFAFYALKHREEMLATQPCTCLKLSSNGIKVLC